MLYCLEWFEVVFALSAGLSMLLNEVHMSSEVQP